MEHIDFVMNYLNDQLKGYIDCCGEDDDVNVEPCRKAIAELEKARMDQEALIEALDIANVSLNRITRRNAKNSDENERMIFRSEFVDWLRNRYGWSFSYFYRICGETRRKEIIAEFFQQRKTKK